MWNFPSKKIINPVSLGCVLQFKQLKRCSCLAFLTRLRHCKVFKLFHILLFSGYFVYDVCDMLVYQRSRQTFELLLHHFVVSTWQTINTHTAVWWKKCSLIKFSCLHVGNCWNLPNHVLFSLYVLSSEGTVMSTYMENICWCDGLT